MSFINSPLMSPARRNLTNARMIEMFTLIAVGPCKMLEGMATPCSVKACGRKRRPPWRVPKLEVTNCDLKTVTS